MCFTKCTTVLWRVAANRHRCARGAVRNCAPVQRPQERRSPASTRLCKQADAADAWSARVLDYGERSQRNTCSVRAGVAAVLDPPGQRCWAEQGAMLGPALWRLLLVRPAWSASDVVPAVPPADCIDMSSLFTAPDGRPPHP